MIVVYGGTSSGKSGIAENIAVDIYKNSCEAEGDNKKLYYLATMETSSDAATKRIARHRKLREGKGFETVEEQLELSRVYDKVKGGIVLLECVSNLVANVLFDRYKEEAIPSNEINVVAKEISDQIIKLGEISELVVVTNNVFGDYYSQDAWCDAYMQVLGRVNEELAAKSDTFLEIVAGRVNVVKGKWNTWLTRRVNTLPSCQCGSRVTDQNTFGKCSCSLKDRARQLKSDIPAVFMALKDKRTPMFIKALAVITVVYALSPIDLIPDFIPILGYLDDVIILPGLIAIIIKLLPYDVWEENKIKSQGMWKDGKPKKWYYAIPIIIVWGLLLGLIIDILLSLF